MASPAWDIPPFGNCSDLHLDYGAFGRFFGPDFSTNRRADDSSFAKLVTILYRYTGGIDEFG